MIALLMLSFLFGDFIQKWYVDAGMIGECGRILISDTDRDGNYEFFIWTYGGSQKIYIYELHLPDTWEIDSFSYFDSPLIWDVGDFDLDGLYDVVIDATEGMPPVPAVSIAESPDSFSYPTQEVWRDTIGQATVAPISVHDIDQDGLPEIVKVGANGINFVIYESIGNNLYEKVYEDTIQGINTPLSTIGFGDFDEDNKIEFVLGNLSDGAGGANYWLYESPGDNAYEFIHIGTVLTKNIIDCFSVSDADGDGKIEFVVKGFVVPTARINAFIFEAISDNTYEIIKRFDLFGGGINYYGGYSEAGDVDGDTVPEIVLEGCQNVYIIKSTSDDSFYLWDTLPGHSSGSNIRIYDIDDNGLAEIIISGNNETRIYEYEPGGIAEAEGKEQEMRLRVHPNPFVKQTRIDYALPKQTSVEIVIYDVSGRKVTILASEIQQPGYYSMVWNGTDDKDRKVASGVYFIRFEADEFKTQDKVLLVK